MILGQIDLFLKDEKYSQYLTTNERADLSAFRKGCFLVDGKTERIDKYISLEVKSKA